MDYCLLYVKLRPCSVYFQGLQSFLFFLGTNFEIPRATAEALHPLAQVPGIATPLDQIAAAGDPSTLQASLALAQQQAQQAAIVSQQQATGGATQSTTPCFMLSNMFDPTR